MCRSVYSIAKGYSTCVSVLCVIGEQYRSTTTITLYKRCKRQIVVTSFRATTGTHCSRFSARRFRSKKSAKTESLVPERSYKNEGGTTANVQMLIGRRNYKIWDLGTFLGASYASWPPLGRTTGSKMSSPQTSHSEESRRRVKISPSSRCLARFQRSSRRWDLANRKSK